MIWIYRPNSSASARLLAESLDGIRMKTEERLRRRVRPTDKVIMWGAYVPNLQGKVLNNVPLRNKFEDAVRLREAGISTVAVSRTRPTILQPVGPPPIDPLIEVWSQASDMAEAFAALQPTRNQVALTGIQELRDALSQTLGAASRPAPVALPATTLPDQSWLARTFDHVGGNDLLRPIAHADYYSKREEFKNEYRVHSFLGHSIRAGKKIPRTPQSETPFHGTPHTWVRSWDGGWMISYADDSGIKQRHRDIAHAAVKALGLAFGAVDIGEREDGTLVVLELNRAPGLEGGTPDAYSHAVRKWTTGEWLLAGVAGAVAA